MKPLTEPWWEEIQEALHAPYSNVRDGRHQAATEFPIWPIYGLPQQVLQKKLRRGGVIARQLHNYVTVLKWHDKRDVLMISTCDDDEMVPTYNWRRDETLKPRMTVEYNTAKKGIDVSDQLGSYYSPLRKSLTWYKKIAYDLMFQAAIVNTRVIYNELTGKTMTVLQKAPPKASNARKYFHHKSPTNRNP